MSKRTVVVAIDLNPETLRYLERPDAGQYLADAIRQRHVASDLNQGKTPEIMPGIRVLSQRMELFAASKVA